MRVTQTDKLVHRRLGFTQAIRPALELVLANLDLPAFDLGQFLAFFLLLAARDDHGAVW
ncbi:hypothetical protein D3C78_1963510 [compost metagenome]